MQSSETLVKEILKGNEAAMELLVKNNYNMVQSFIYRFTGDYNISYDMTQEVFIKMIKNLNRFKFEDGNFESWILKIASNHCKDYFRSNSFKQRNESSNIGDIEIEDNEVIIDILEKNEKRKAVKKAVDVLRAYMPKAKEKYKAFKLIKNGITYVNKIYWIISMLVMILGIIMTNEPNYSGYETLLYISPIPIILGIYEVGRSKREKMWELEKSFKYSYSKVMFAKMIIIMAFTTIINMFLSLFIYSGQNSSELLRIMTAWIAPICIVFSINIIISSKISSNYSIMLTSVIWIITLVLGRERIIGFIEGAEIISLIITISISIIVFLIATLQFYSDTEKYEGELEWS